jgi:hypothetical protein
MKKDEHFFVAKSWNILSETSPYKNIHKSKRNKAVLEDFSTIFIPHPSIAHCEQNLMPPLGLRRRKSRVGESLKKT